MADQARPDGWDLDDKDTWLDSGDPDNREEMRRLLLQAERTLDESRGTKWERSAILGYNRIKRYWDRVK